MTAGLQTSATLMPEARSEPALAVTQARYWHLKHMSLFRGLADRELRQLVELCELRLFARGETVFDAGAQADGLYVLRTGRVKLCRTIDSGDDRAKNVIMKFAGPGELIGELAIIAGHIHSQRADVVEDALICIFELDRFEAFLGQRPNLALRISTIIAERSMQVEDRIIELLSNDVQTRLAHALAELADDHGEPMEEGIRIELRLTQTDLGQLVGSTRETTNMAFNRFRRLGLVDARDGQIWVLDQLALSRF